MFFIDSKTFDQIRRIREAESKGTLRSLHHAGFAARKEARESIKTSDEPAPEGQPPHTHTRQFYRRAFWTSATQHDVIIGPRFSIVGDVGEALEITGRRKGQQIGRRPVWDEVLPIVAARLPESWDGQIGA